MKKLFILLISALFLFASCKKEKVNNDSSENVNSMTELNISSDFNWKTTKDYQIKLTASNSSLVKVENGNGVVFQKAFLMANETYNMKLTLPSYQKTVHIKFLDEVNIVKLESSELECKFK